MKTQYTPAPWQVDNKAAGHVRTPDGRGIANTMGYSNNSDGGKSYEENKANARLIAAAPELLEVLEKTTTWLFELNEWYKREADSFEGVERQMYLDHSATVIKIMRDSKTVIEKATGGNP